MDGFGSIKKSDALDSLDLLLFTEQAFTFSGEIQEFSDSKMAGKSFGSAANHGGRWTCRLASNAKVDDAVLATSCI